LDWLTLNAKNGYEIDIPVPEEQTNYESKLHLKGGTNFVRRVQDTPRLIGKVLHQWDINVTYQTLTLEEIIRSVQRADITNLLHEGERTLKDYVTTVMEMQPRDSQEDEQKVQNLSNIERASPYQGYTENHEIDLKS